jgi:hemerythrin
MYLEMLKFLRDWLSNHVVEEDQKYQPWLNEHGVR